MSVVPRDASHSEKPVVLTELSCCNSLSFLLHTLLAAVFICRPLRITNGTDKPIAVHQHNDNARGDEGYDNESDENDFVLQPAEELLTYVHLLSPTTFNFFMFNPLEYPDSGVEGGEVKEPKLARLDNWWEFKLHSFYLFYELKVCGISIPIPYTRRVTPNTIVVFSDVKKEFQLGEVTTGGIVEQGWIPHIKSRQAHFRQPHHQSMFEKLSDDDEDEVPENKFDVISIIESIQTYYSEGILVFLGVYSFVRGEDIGNSVMLILVSFIVMIYDATRKSPGVCFCDFTLGESASLHRRERSKQLLSMYGYPSNHILSAEEAAGQGSNTPTTPKSAGASSESSQSGKDQQSAPPSPPARRIMEVDCINDGSFYVIPMILNGGAVLLIEQTASGPATVTGIFTASVAFGYLAFGFLVVQLAIYAKIEQDLRKVTFFKDGNWADVICYVGSGLPLWVGEALILYLAFFPFEGQAYLIGGVILIVTLPVLGMKGILLPYAFGHLALFGVFGDLATFIMSLDLSAVMDSLRAWRKQVFEYSLIILAVAHLILGIGAVLLLIYLIKGGEEVEMS